MSKKLLESSSFITMNDVINIYKAKTFSYFKEELLEKRGEYTPARTNNGFNNKSEYDEEDTITEENKEYTFAEKHLYEYSASNQMKKREEIYKNITDVLNYMNFMEKMIEHDPKRVYVDNVNNRLDERFTVAVPEHRDPANKINFSCNFDKDVSFVREPIDKFTTGLPGQALINLRKLAPDDKVLHNLLEGLHRLIAERSIGNERDI